MNLIRLLILACIGYTVYNLYRQFAGRQRVSPQTAPQPAGRERAEADVLVQDPVCQTYIPQQEAVALIAGTTTYYFCSPECRKKFQNQTRS